METQTGATNVHHIRLRRLFSSLCDYLPTDRKNQVSFGQFKMVQRKCSEILVIIDVHIKPELFRPQPSEVAIIVIIVDTILLSDLPYSL